MTERTYGSLGFTLKQLENGHPWEATVAMAAHIRELQAEVNIYKSCTTPTEINLAARILELESEVEKLKNERREFGMRVAEAVHEAYGYSLYVDLTAIVEQELNK